MAERSTLRPRYGGSGVPLTSHSRQEDALEGPTPLLYQTDGLVGQDQVQQSAAPVISQQNAAQSNSREDRAKFAVKRFDGHWLIYRKVPRGLSRTAGGSRLPRFRHPTFKSAQVEAERLLGEHPESTFVIMQEQATVKAGGAA